MSRKPKINIEEFKKLWHYDPFSGMFTRLVASKNGRHKAGSCLATFDKDGYLKLRYANIDYRAHRVAWLYVTGKEPIDVIDHKNRIRYDNRFVNLRDVPQRINMLNMRKFRTNTSGVNGVSFFKASNKYEAYIWDNGKKINLGLFSTLEEATLAREEANIVYSYKDGHGK